MESPYYCDWVYRLFSLRKLEPLCRTWSLMIHSALLKTWCCLCSAEKKNNDEKHHLIFSVITLALKCDGTHQTFIILSFKKKKSSLINVQHSPESCRWPPSVGMFLRLPFVLHKSICVDEIVTLKTTKKDNDWCDMHSHCGLSWLKKQGRSVSACKRPQCWALFCFSAAASFHCRASCDCDKQPVGILFCTRLVFTPTMEKNNNMHQCWWWSF